jgi:diguanylate cyclase (GGDEF)-like protein
VRSPVRPAGTSASRYARISAGSCVLFLVWLCLPGRSPELRQAVSSLSFVIAPAAASWRCVVAARRRDAWSRTWSLVASALGVWALGSAIWVYLDARGPAPFPSPADAAWLLFPLLGIAALLSLPSMPRRATPAARLMLDGVATAAALLLVARLGFYGTVGREVHGLGHWVVTAYPSLDVLAGSVVIVTLDRLRSGLRHPGVLIALGLCGACGSDLTYALLSTHGAYSSGGPLDSGWAASFLLIGVAAGLPAPRERETPVTQHRLLPTVPAVLAITVLLASGRLSSGLDTVLIVEAVVLSGALAARQHLLAAENRALQGSLEQRVADRTTELEDAREVFRRRAYTDPLTGLSNRDAFNEALAAAAIQQRGGFLAVVLLDLDGFKQVNDGFGHESGDDVLIAVADRLRRSLRRRSPGQQEVTRLGGDEFACLLTGLESPADADRVAERLLHAMRESVVVDGREFFLGASAGVAVAATPMDRTPSDLLREADTAMYVAKDAGGNRFRTFDTHMHSAVVERVALEADLHRALADGEIRVQYQPIHSLREGRITGVEALARWHHPVRGHVSPIDFIAVAERTGLIVELERQVLEQVCAQMVRWRGVIPDLKVGVNFSARHLREPDMVAPLLDCLARHDLPPSTLVAEVTESLFFTDEDVVGGVLQSLDDAGIVLALDDFGTGYSSLSRLSRHPFTILKVDRSFLAELRHGDRQPTILLATFAMARGLGLDVVAEGVETEEQLAFLRGQDCPFAQGYLLDRPVWPEEIDRLLSPVSTRV